MNFLPMDELNNHMVECWVMIVKKFMRILIYFSGAKLRIFFNKINYTATIIALSCQFVELLRGEPGESGGDSGELGFEAIDGHYVDSVRTSVGGSGSS